MKLNFISLCAFALLLVAAVTIVSCQDEQSVEFNRYYSLGNVVYQTHCQNCHGANGEGLQGLIPPLTDSIYLKNNRHQLACSVKYGLKGKLTIAGRSFEGVMPPNDLAPVDLAQVLTYVNNSFGNKAGIINITQIQTDLSSCK